MSQQADFLHDLLYQGKIVFGEQPDFTAAQGPAAVTLLREAYESYRLEVAGSLIEFDAASAVAAAELVRKAAWYLVNRDESETDLERILKLAPPPRTPAQHLSADLVLRYLPQIHRRARALAPGDRLAALLAEVLRQWPLSGVLSDAEEEPLTPLEFGHPGLLLLYAERLAHNPKPAWRPAAGLAREYVELVTGGKMV